ncbi:hypothetical protein JYP46_03080 [Nitratireductor aquimarinus]|uniref:hypothetical protein n=1 Tax=Alphaproteobacteria TaxID=28211 RepID=UPI0019D40EF7|nr:MULTISPECIES: hypothetical protein [Alphaproteobacteria]MBN7755798.1 hypothetical protein [Nitratireductor aquimarinus]MBY5998552.1 hypothetical protein [Tritonibacter mobilis]MBY6020584.1 hypothetical protein [Nitratireductor sp. DP7N14-4]MDV2967060.1 hypothetical protein [Nitratireductor aquimarinus]
MTTASTLLHSIALSACLTIQAVPGSSERPSGIRRALQTLSTQQTELCAMAAPADAAHLAGLIDRA